MEILGGNPMMHARFKRFAGFGSGALVIALGCTVAAAPAAQASVHPSVPIGGVAGPVVGIGTGGSLVGIGTGAPLVGIGTGGSIVGVGAGSGSAGPLVAVGTGGSVVGVGGPLVAVGSGAVPMAPAVPTVTAAPAAPAALTVTTVPAAPVVTTTAPTAPTAPRAGAPSGAAGGSSTGSTTVTLIGGGSGAPVATQPGDRPVPKAAAPLVVTASWPTVYPVKDGYRDEVTFALSGATSAGTPATVTGTATLSSGSDVVKTWDLTSSSQRLTWDGRDGGAVKPGVYRLVATVTDAAGTTATAASRVTASAKRLEPVHTVLRSTAVSGFHRMAAAPRSGLSKGRVTLRVTVVASHVHGTQSIAFVKNGKRLVVPVRNGRHTSRTITIPKSFTSFRIAKSWKGKSVRIGSIQYHYRYRALR